MPFIKKVKDNLIKFVVGSDLVPKELSDLHAYFRMYGPINFEYKKEGDKIVAVSTNFRYGSIVTSGKNKEELDKNIKDAILTSFDLPSSYAKEARIKKVGDNKQKEHAFA